MAMNTETRSGHGDGRGRVAARARQVVEGLHMLSEVQAPAALLPAVMTRVGLGDAYAPLDTPAGRVLVAYNALGVSAIEHADDADAFQQRFRARFGRAAYPVEAVPAALASAIAEGLRGHGGSSAARRCTVDLRGLTSFERSVLEKTREIPSGEVRPYAWVAREIGRPRAVRAVGTALAHNPIPLLIPCHRVVRSDGATGAYSLGGAEVKREVLRAEGVDLDELAALVREGVRFIGSDSTHVFCLPSCRHARRIGGRHRVRFASEAAAVRAGYHPCLVCRPAVLASA